MNGPVMTPGAYGRFCGPRTVAAALGGGPLRAARSLLALQRLRGQQTAPGTLPEDMALLAIRAGWTVERWSVRRLAPGILETADALRTRLATELDHDRASPPAPLEDGFQRAWAELAPTLPDRGWNFILEQRAKAARKRFTVEEFMHLNRAGRWWLITDRLLTAGDFNTHVLVARDGRIPDADDARVCAALPLLDAFRLIPPTEEKTP